MDTKVPVLLLRHDSRTLLVAAGSLLGALASSSCCILPLALFSIGATGAWIGALTSLAPYQPIFLVVASAFLAGGFWLAYRKPVADRCEGSYCAAKESMRVVRFALWGSAVLVVAAAAFPFVAPFVVG